jgi:hypothetical protein
LEAEEIFARFFSGFCTPLVTKRPKALKKNRTKQPREKKKNGRKKSRIFLMSPDGFFLEKKFLPCF